MKKPKLLKLLSFVLFLTSSMLVSGQVSNPNGDTSIKAFNDAFLVTSGGRTYYKKALNDTGYDGSWTLALDIFGMQDAYERTGSAAHKTIVNDLCNSFLIFNPTPYSADGWNDDVAWMGLGLARGYQITGTANLLKQAESCFNLAYSRGWNTIFNDGGIWEQQPDMTPHDGGVNKEALSNNPNGKLACLLYEGTGNIDYKNKAIQIYNWSRSHIFNPASGQVYTNVDRDYVTNMGTAVYNQGSFIDFASMLYKITGDETILRDAQMAADYVIKNMTTNGIISNDAGYLNTWADEYARGLGHLCMWNPQLWNTYYSFMKKNADAAWANRRTDLNLSWNGWTKQTPVDPAGFPTKYVSTVAIQQYTPTVQTIPGTIEAEAYNFMKGIKVENCSEGGFDIGSIDAGNWLEYIVNIPATKFYNITCRVAGTANGSISLQQNGKTLTTVNLPNTGGSQIWSDVSTTVQLTAGIQSIKLLSSTGGWSINKWTATACQPIVPYVSVNGAGAIVTSSATLNVGDILSLKPEPQDGTWSWIGPNGFTKDTREITISPIQQEQGGVYTATYMSLDGCVSFHDFMISLNGCAASPIVGNVQVNNGAWLQIDKVTFAAGGVVSFDPQPQDGIWSWTGPNGFTSKSRQITINAISNKQTGDYIATYYNASGCKSTKAFTVVLTGSDPCSTPIVHFVTVNGGNWQQVSYATLNIGESFNVGPQPSDGTWKWTGPNGFTANTREFTITNFKAIQAGYYTATYTNPAGCVRTSDFIVGVKGCVSTSVTPDIQVNGSSWLKIDSVVIASGGNIAVNLPVGDGVWSWSKLNGLTSNSIPITFNKILNRQAGKYVAAFYNTNGCGNTYAVNIAVTGDDYCGTPIIPYVSVNNLAWQKTALAYVKTGGSLVVGPQTPVNGEWVWKGPNGFSSYSRDFTLNGITVAKGGTYSAIFTNSLGCESHINIIVVVDGINGIDNLSEENSGLLLYPNPASNMVTLTGVPTNTAISVFDLSGRSLLHLKSSDNNVIIDVNNFKKGIYFLRIGKGEGKNLKLIKE